MNTLKEVYDLYRENEPNATVIEERCLQTGCYGDIYRARIAKLEKTNRRECAQLRRLAT